MSRIAEKAAAATPGTEAGRALLERQVPPPGSHEAECATCRELLEAERGDEADAILAIEAEAVAAERARIVAAVKAHRCEGNHTPYCTGKLHSTETVLTIIEGES